MFRSSFTQVSLYLIGSLCFQSVHSLGALADIPAFQTQLNFGISCPLWDPTDRYEFTKDVPVLGLGTTTIAFTLSANDKGTITGTGSWTASVIDPVEGLIEMNLFDSNVKGKIRSSDLVTRFNLKSTMKGPCGQLCPGIKKWTLVGKFKFSGEVDGTGTADGLLTLSLKIRKTFSGLVIQGGIFKESTPFAFPVAQDSANDGSWDLNLNMTSTDGQALAGTAEVMLVNGRIIDNLVGRGKFDAGNDTSKLSFKGLGGAKIKLIDLTADGNTQTLIGGTLNYKILGQKREISLNSSCIP